MTIKYSDQNVRQLLVKGTSHVKVHFYAEFNMISKKFWNAMIIASGFLLAIAIMLWIFQLYNWQNRNKILLHLLPRLLYMMVIGLHTLAIILLLTLLLICVVWYVFC